MSIYRVRVVRVDSIRSVDHGCTTGMIAESGRDTSGIKTRAQKARLADEHGDDWQSVDEELADEDQGMFIAMLPAFVQSKGSPCEQINR